MNLFGLIESETKPNPNPQPITLNLTLTINRMGMPLLAHFSFARFSLARIWSPPLSANRGATEGAREGAVDIIQNTNFKTPRHA